MKKIITDYYWSKKMGDISSTIQSRLNDEWEVISVLYENKEERYVVFFKKDNQKKGKL